MSFENTTNEQESALPETRLPEGYNGKFILAELDGRTYFRAVAGCNDHSDIYEEFVGEIECLSLNGDPDILGGGRVEFRQDGSIYIHGRSIDLGECDKGLAKELVSRKYKDRKIITDREESK